MPPNIARYQPSQELQLKNSSLFTSQLNDERNMNQSASSNIQGDKSINSSRSRGDSIGCDTDRTAHTPNQDINQQQQLQTLNQKNKQYGIQNIISEESSNRSTRGDGDQSARNQTDRTQNFSGEWNKNGDIEYGQDDIIDDRNKMRIKGNNQHFGLISNHLFPKTHQISSSISPLNSGSKSPQPDRQQLLSIDQTEYGSENHQGSNQLILSGNKVGLSNQISFTLPHGVQRPQILQYHSSLLGTSTIHRMPGQQHNPHALLQPLSSVPTPVISQQPNINSSKYPFMGSGKKSFFSDNAQTGEESNEQQNNVDSNTQQITNMNSQYNDKQNPAKLSGNNTHQNGPLFSIITNVPPPKQPLQISGTTSFFQISNKDKGKETKIETTENESWKEKDLRSNNERELEKIDENENENEDGNEQQKDEKTQNTDSNTSQDNKKKLIPSKPQRRNQIGSVLPPLDVQKKQIISSIVQPKLNINSKRIFQSDSKGSLSYENQASNINGPQIRTSSPSQFSQVQSSIHASNSNPIIAKKITPNQSNTQLTQEKVTNQQTTPRSVDKRQLFAQKRVSSDVGQSSVMAPVRLAQTQINTPPKSPYQYSQQQSPQITSASMQTQLPLQLPSHMNLNLNALNSVPVVSPSQISSNYNHVQRFTPSRQPHSSIQPHPSNIYRRLFAYKVIYNSNECIGGSSYNSSKMDAVAHFHDRVSLQPQYDHASIPDLTNTSRK
ncbi:MAG: hypothetical protein EZS28_007749 [Streblomastix strix]|uniref:Uncharacterized protein n=1 Tax=Streblomastix strix TaxID=222440 RepID=A0A5J4WP43_9EUKA|nr:MAG: hypothetical protein EZS28_007749 [Streblomastix strix]